MAWRIAKSLATLRDQINAAAPQRSKVSDGAIGDANHSSRASDHNPNGKGVVCAIDITDDPADGCSAEAIAESLKSGKDPRIGYIIWNRRISNPTIQAGAWRPYTGSNPHNKHVHVSVKQDAKLYDDAKPWAVTTAPSKEVAGAAKPLPPARPLLKKGSKGDSVRILQNFLKIESDGDFGPATEAAVKVFQKAKGLVADGIVGSYTWDALFEKPAPVVPAKSDGKTSAKGIAHIKSFESCVLDAHKVGGVWHIGWGHSATSGKPPIPVEGLKITAAEADAIFVSDLKEYEDLIGETVIVPLTQGQFDALVSIAFNKGPTWFRKSQLLLAVNAENMEGAQLEILRQVPAITHQFYKGLLRRRQAEVALFKS